MIVVERANWPRSRGQLEKLRFRPSTLHHLPKFLPVRKASLVTKIKTCGRQAKPEGKKRGDFFVTKMTHKSIP